MYFMTDFGLQSLTASMRHTTSQVCCLHALVRKVYLEHTSLMCYSVYELFVDCTCTEHCEVLMHLQCLIDVLQLMPITVGLFISVACHCKECSF